MGIESLRSIIANEKTANSSASFRRKNSRERHANVSTTLLMLTIITLLSQTACDSSPASGETTFAAVQQPGVQILLNQNDSRCSTTASPSKLTAELPPIKGLSYLGTDPGGNIIGKVEFEDDNIAPAVKSQVYTVVYPLDNENGSSKETENTVGGRILIKPGTSEFCLEVGIGHANGNVFEKLVKPKIELGYISKN